MDAVQFIYWLQGYIEMGGGPPSEEQWETIKDHLALVMPKVTPNRNPPIPPAAAAPIVVAPNKGWEDKKIESNPPSRLTDIDEIVRRYEEIKPIATPLPYVPPAWVPHLPGNDRRMLPPGIDWSKGPIC